MSVSKNLFRSSSLPSIGPTTVGVRCLVHQYRRQSTYAAFAEGGSKHAVHARTSSPGLQRLPTSALLRNILLGTFMTTPILLKPIFAGLRKVARSESALLNPDRNPVLKALIKPLIYDQFCAGRDRAEISQTRGTIKQMGYSGVILGYGREIQVELSNRQRLSLSRETNGDLETAEWEKGNLDTIDMLGEGDWLAIKFTGAGNAATGALLRNEAPPARFQQAMEAICSKARAKNCRIWVDSEQQVVQTAIDRWTIDLMRKHNKNADNVLIYNTLQAYLKTSREKLIHQLTLANNEGWTLAIKLVRGAYINNDTRSAIHDTKQETDDSYNGIVRDLINGNNLGFTEGKFPKMQLFLAGHNPNSVSSAWDLVQTRGREGKLQVIPEFGQLQGMGDVLGCQVLEKRAELLNGYEDRSDIVVPRIYKCSTWGSLQECLQYLLRRVVENSGGTDRMRDGLALYRQELRRRLFASRR